MLSELIEITSGWVVVQWRDSLSLYIIGFIVKAQFCVRVCVFVQLEWVYSNDQSIGNWILNWTNSGSGTCVLFCWKSADECLVAMVFQRYPNITKKLILLIQSRISMWLVAAFSVGLWAHLLLLSIVLWYQFVLIVCVSLFDLDLLMQHRRTCDETELLLLMCLWQYKQHTKNIFEGENRMIALKKENFPRKCYQSEERTFTAAWRKKWHKMP